MTEHNNQAQTFWEHLDVLRSCIIRIVLAVVVAGLTAFVLKDEVFSLVLAPSRSSFFFYQWLGAEPFHLQLINTGLTEQFMIHMKVAVMVGFILASPYVLYVLLGFITPALYAHERRYSLRLTLAAYAMFLVGVAVNYCIIFPLTVRFLGTYSVSADVETMLSLESYIDTLMGMSLVMGVVFEMPVMSWLLARFGLLRAEWMTRVRRHAIVAILIVAAGITPTSDIFTLLVVTLPIYLLYELSIVIVRWSR